MITIHFPTEAESLRDAFCKSLAADGIPFDEEPIRIVFEHHGKQPKRQGTKIATADAANVISKLCLAITPMIAAYFASSANRSIKVELPNQTTVEVKGFNDLERLQSTWPLIPQPEECKESPTDADPNTTTE